jgi:hypothetical protein
MQALATDNNKVQQEAILYIRVSSDEQVNGHCIPRQLEINTS